MDLDFTDYLSELFPNFGTVQTAGAMMMYEGLGNDTEQATLAFGECAYVPSIDSFLKL
jgi:hypothetical protein